MRIQLPTVDIDLLQVLRDSVQIAAAHIEENWEEKDWSGVLADMRTLGVALETQAAYAERGIRTTIKPLVGVFRTAKGLSASDEAVAAWRESHPYVCPELAVPPENS